MKGRLLRDVLLTKEDATSSLEPREIIPFEAFTWIITWRCPWLDQNPPVYHINGPSLYHFRTISSPLSSLNHHCHYPSLDHSYTILISCTQFLYHHYIILIIILIIIIPLSPPKKIVVKTSSQNLMLLSSPSHLATVEFSPSRCLHCRPTSACPWYLAWGARPAASSCSEKSLEPSTNGDLFMGCCCKGFKNGFNFNIWF